MSSIVFWIFFFHCGGMILRTGVLYRFVDSKALSAPVRAPAKRLAGLLRQTQGTKSAFGDSFNVLSEQGP
jgi:hypothetical protein